MSRGPAKQFDPQEALDRAVDVFWTRGYESASLTELLQAMKIGRKSLYDTFGSKHDLFQAAMARYAETQFATIHQILTADRRPLANIRALLWHWEKDSAQPNSKGCLFGNNMPGFGPVDATTSKLIFGYVKQVEDAICSTLRAARQAGELNPAVQPREAARMIVCLSQGMALLSRVSGETSVFQTPVAAMLRLLEA